jgi:hypothetical protein
MNLSRKELQRKWQNPQEKRQKGQNHRKKQKNGKIYKGAIKSSGIRRPPFGITQAARSTAGLTV